MRASLNQIKDTERFLSNQLSVEDALVFEAKLLTNPILRANAAVQQKLIVIVKAFGRKQLKQELKAIHDDLFSDPQKLEFQKEILKNFTR